MARTDIPMTALRNIAERLISNDEKVQKRTNKRRPRSKVAILRDLMRSDSELYGRVVTLFRQMQSDSVKADMERDGLTIRSASETADADPKFLEWTPEERRSWRLTWAREQLRGNSMPNLSAWGGPITAEELAFAESLDGAVPPELADVGAFARFEL